MALPGFGIGHIPGSSEHLREAAALQCYKHLAGQPAVPVVVRGCEGAADELPAALTGLGETSRSLAGTPGVERCPSDGAHRDKPTVPQCGQEQPMPRPRLGLSPGPGLDPDQGQTQTGTEPWIGVRLGSVPSPGSGLDPDWD